MRQKAKVLRMFLFFLLLTAIPIFLVVNICNSDETPLPGPTGQINDAPAHHKAGTVAVSGKDPHLPTAGGHENLGAKLPLSSCIPFAGMLLSIALMPLIAADFWHHHFGKVSAF